MSAPHRLVIQALHNHEKSFTVDRRTDAPVVELVNQHYADPRREGIPALCTRGVCRSCTIKIVEHPELLQAPSALEQRALGVGRTAIIHGYRLACMSYFQDPDPARHPEEDT
jgi:ferredoxin